MAQHPYAGRPQETVPQLPDRYVMFDAQGTVVHDVDLKKARKAHARNRKYRRT